MGLARTTLRVVLQYVLGVVRKRVRQLVDRGFGHPGHRQDDVQLSSGAVGG